MNQIIGLFFMALAPLLFYLLIYKSYVESIKDKISTKKNEIVISGVVIVLFMVFSYIIMKQDRFIYFWDYGREWKSSLYIRSGLIANPLAELKDIYNSVNNSDYNKLMPTLMALPLYIKDSFKGFVWILELLYLCPAFIFLSLLIKRIITEVFDIEIPLYICLLVAICNPIIYYITFFGFMGGCLFLLVVSTIAISYDIDYSKINIKKDILLSILLILIVLFRRYFAYYVVGFVVSQLFMAAIQISENIENRILIIKNYIINMIAIGVPAVCFLLIFFGRFLIHSVFNNHASSYSAYDASLTIKLSGILTVFGWAVIIGAWVLSALAALENKKCRKIVLPLYVNTVVPVVMMWRIQQLNNHHFSMIIIQAIILYTIGYCWLFKKIVSKRTILVCCAFFSLLGISNMLVTFAPSLKNFNGIHTLSGYKYEPKIRNDVEAIQRIVSDMNDLYINDNQSSFYILASSGILNSQIIQFANYPDLVSDVPNLYGTSDVDLVSGFPIGFLNATYVLTTDPIQTHLPSGQTVVTHLAEEIQDETSILGGHYACVSEYQLDNDVHAKLYKLTLPLDNSVYKELYNYYNGEYPEEKELFANRISQFIK